MFCAKCGKEIKEGMKHCPFCGEIVKKENTSKAAVSSDEKKKLKKTKIILIIIALLLIGGMYNAVTENEGGNSVLIGEWDLAGMGLEGLGYSSSLPPNLKDGYYVKFFKNGTYELRVSETKLKGTWSEDAAIAQKAKYTGSIWGGRVKLTGANSSIQPGIIIVSEDSFNTYEGSYFLVYMTDDGITYVFTK